MEFHWEPYLFASPALPRRKYERRKKGAEVMIDLESMKMPGERPATTDNSDA